MARFVFQLDGVLHHRERIEKDRQRELAVVQAVLVGLQAELRALNEDIAQSSAQVQNRLVGRLDMYYLAAHRRYMLGMQRKLTVQAEKIAGQQKLADEARRMLAEASKQKKILEKLRERHQQRWTAAEALREAGALDELTTQMSYYSLAGQSEGNP
jgi:flagellar FliJ protein